MFNLDEAKKILQAADIVSVISQRITLKKRGKDYWGKCPFHNDTTPSFTVSPAGQFFKCFGCGASGDVAEFVQKFDRVDFKEAVNLIGGGLASGLIPDVANVPKPPPAPGQIQPVPLEAPEPAFQHIDYGTPSRVFTYRNRQGQLIGFTCRFDPPNDRKQILPYTYRADGKWKWKGFDKPRPLFGLEKLDANPDAPILLVEGEKAAEFAQLHLHRAVVLSWYGGVEGARHVDFSPIFGRKLVILWPDNDYTHVYKQGHPKEGQVKPWFEQPGKAVMLEIANILKPHVSELKWVESPQDTPCGWDCADKQWIPNELRNYILGHISPVPQPEPPSTVLIPDTPTQPPVMPPNAPNQAPEQIEDFPFTFLGFRKDGDTPKFCFYAGTSKTVISLSASAMGKQNLMLLAPLNWWEEHFPASKGARNPFDVDAAAQFLMGKSFQTGIFSESRIRGRGAWMDEGRTVLHSGDHLIVDGHRTELSRFRTRYIYEQCQPMQMDIGRPIPTELSSKLIDMLQVINWERGVNAYLLAGWCVIAPVCGALPWRPNIWVTGAAGTGKTWVFKNVVRRLLGDTALAVQGRTTEPGIRALLGHDSLPVIFDEAEGEDQASQARMQSVLELMRGASSDGGVLAQGSQGGGGAKTFRIRSMFAFASIGVQVKQQADRTRVTILSIKRRTGPDREILWAHLQSIYAQIINDEFVSGLQARTISMLPVILANAEVFNKAAVAVLGEQRHGDQLGAMIAGAYSLRREGLVDYETALKFVESMDWNEERSLDASRDEYRLLNKIMEHQVEVELEYQKVKRQIGELCLIAASINHPLEDAVTATQASKTLLRNGIKIDFRAVDDVRILISNSSNGIKSILEKTPWGGENHNKILLRIDKAEPTEPTKFGPTNHRAVSIPMSVLSN